MRALISVSDKSGVENFAKELVSLGYEIISTGGTYNKLKDAGIAVIEGRLAAAKVKSEIHCAYTSFLVALV